MPLPIPQIDDIEFEQLVEEAKALIPRYAPKWTDHNLHDPGITLLELLAWIVDQQIYQVGFVSDRHLRAFAALLGVRPKAAIPARGLIWPKKQPDNAWQQAVLEEKDLPRGEKIICTQQSNIAFALDANIHLTPAKPASADGGVTANLVNKRIDLTRFIQQQRSSFVFQAESDGEKNLEMAFDQPLVRLGDYPIALGIEIDSIVASARAEGRIPWDPLFFEYQTDLLPWQRLQVVEDSTFSLSRTGVVLLKIPADEQATSSRLRLRLDRGFYPLPIQIVRLEVNVLPVVQLEEQPVRVIGRSNGLPNQMFSVEPAELSELPEEGAKSQSPADVPFPYPFRIEIEEDYRFREWAQAEDLSSSKPLEQVYRVDVNANKIVFGNGVNGKIPPNEAQIQSKAFHTTRGSEGNLAAGLDWRIAGVTMQDSIFGTNPQPIAGGENAWDIERLMDEARQRVLERQVMLSDQDLQNTVKSLKGFGVARVDVIPRFHPAFPSQEVKGMRTVVVTPWRKSADMTTIIDTRYLNAVAAAIEPYRVLGERLKVITHQRVSIHVEATLVINAGKDNEKIRAEAVKRIKGRFTDIALQDGYSNNPWPLGRPVTTGEIKALLSTIPDVIAVPVCRLARENGPLSEQAILLKRDEVAVGTEDNFKIDFLENRAGSLS